MRQIPLQPCRLRRGLGMAFLAVALLAAGTGCGTRQSDTEIAEAARGPVATGTTDVPVSSPAEVSTITGTSGTAAAPVAARAAMPVAADPAAPAAAKSTSHEARTTAGNKPAALTPAGNVAAAGEAPSTGPAVASPSVANKSVVKIGSLGPYSGVLGAVFGDAPKTVNVWAAMQNAHGGVNGHPVKVIIADDQGDPGTALTLTHRMVESDKVIAMVSNYILFGFDQIEKYLREKNVPLIGGDGVLSLWYSSPVAFPVSTHAPDQIVKGLQTFIDHGAHKIALLYCLEVSALCTYLSKEVQKSPIGKYIADTYQVSLVAPSYTSQCLRMKQSGIDAIWLGMDTAGAGRLVQDCANQGFKPPALLLGLDATSSMPQLPALSQALVPGATFPPVDVGVPAVARYLQAMATYGRGLGHSGATSFGWASAEMFGLAARNLSDNPTSAELFTALWKVRDEDLGGLIPPVTYVEGKGAQVRSCIFLWAVKDDRWNAPNGAKLSC